MGFLCYSVCKVIVLSLDLVVSRDDGGDQGLVWEDNRVGESNSVVSVQCYWSPSPGQVYICVVFVQDSLCVLLQQSPGMCAGVDTPDQRSSRFDSV